nr:MAG TPA: hypothetical protein [Caudoviricetes sp.]
MCAVFLFWYKIIKLYNIADIFNFIIKTKRDLNGNNI